MCRPGCGQSSGLWHGRATPSVNFVSGFEMELDTAQSLRSGFAGPTYADLHSLFLGVGSSGLRVPRELPSWGAWLRCFDAVQMNAEEFELLGRAVGDPWALAAQIVGPELKLITITLGANGSGYVAGAAFNSDPFSLARHPASSGNPQTRTQWDRTRRGLRRDGGSHGLWRCLGSHAPRRAPTGGSTGAGDGAGEPGSGEERGASRRERASPAPQGPTLH